MKQKKNELFYSTPSINFIPGAEEFLRWLLETNQNFVIVTNTTHNTVRYFQEKQPILQKITQWITREDVSQPKPAAEPYILAKERYWKNEPFIIGFENTKIGYDSVSNVTKIIYILCENNSTIYKQLIHKDLYFISNFSDLL